MKQLKSLHAEVLRLLHEEGSAYAQPVDSVEIGKALNVTPSYIRSQLTSLVKAGVIGVRRGNGGGYYLIGEAPGYYEHDG